MPTRMLPFVFPVFLFFLFILFLGVARAGPVYRCPGADGVLRFTDRACPGIGEEVPDSELQANVYAAEPVAEAPRLPRATPTAPASRETGCDNADDLRQLDLMLDSLVTDKRQQRFLKAERRRVLACQLESLSLQDRRLRDAALNRTGALRTSEREAAEREIEALYARRRARAR